MINSNDWVKLQKIDGWGEVYYAESHSPSMQKSTHGVHHAFDKIEIRWPDKTEEVVNVTTRIIRQQLDPHCSDISIKLPVIIANLHGIEKLVEFSEVEIRRRCLAGPGLFDQDPDDEGEVG